MTTPDPTHAIPSALIAAALTGPCDGCGAPGALYLATSHERYCVACHSKRVLYEAAEEHLYALLEPTFTAWAGYTRQMLTVQEMRELLFTAAHNLETLLDDEVKDTKVPARTRTDWTV